jgi:macrodomain Ter protein organizer (MatP/YcbG family)
MRPLGEVAQHPPTEAHPHAYNKGTFNTRPMTRTKAIATIQKLLGLHNNAPANVYTWVHRYDDAQLQQMLNGWQTNQPEMFAQHGYYVM